MNQLKSRLRSWLSFQVRVLGYRLLRLGYLIEAPYSSTFVPCTPKWVSYKTVERKKQEAQLWSEAVRLVKSAPVRKV